MKRPQFSLRTMLLLFIPIALLCALVKWLWFPAPVTVLIYPQPFCCLCRYDDGAGNLPLAAIVRVTNISGSTIWAPASGGDEPAYSLLQLVDGKWENSTSGPAGRRWIALHDKDSITILASPISEKATEFKVGVPLTAEVFSPSKMHWIFSPEMKIVKKGHDYFPEKKDGATQEDQVLPWSEPRP
jgi:hypothetical protein